MFVEPIEDDLENQECTKSHSPNEVTKKALEDVKTRKGLKKAETVEELFKKLGQ